ncbi:MAG: hypothetical protein ACJ764_03300 [Solirubrobacteraceae bacterium]
MTVVVHRNGASLALARPAVPLVWALTAPAARRYVGGWASRHELHLLAPSVLERRASSVPGSREMLALTPVALYARQLIGASNRDLAARSGPRRLAAHLRWAWLLEGAARWFSGQTDYARPAIARRLREGRPPHFPPGMPDALLLGGTVIDLLVAEEGQAAAAELARELNPGGAATALRRAFRGRSLAHTESAWRAHLSGLAAGR